MIQGTYYKEWSTVLGREMEFKVYGHAGVPVLALPARGGRFYDWENNGMPDAIAQLLNEGKVQLFCADAMDGEGLLNGDLPQRRRAELQEKYFVYLTAELAPRILTLNNAKKGTRIWTAGVDLGAYHAVHCRLRRPTLFAGAVGMGGIYDLTRFWGTDSDDMVLRCAPLAYLQENGIANKPALAKAEENSLILCAGQGAYEGDALAVHANWIDELIAKYGTSMKPEAANKAVKAEIGTVFSHVLENAGVFKQDAQGQAAFVRFMQSVGFKKV